MKNHQGHHIYICFLSLACLLLWACNSQQTSGQQQAKSHSSMKIMIQHYMVPCTGMDAQWCMIFKEEGKEEWQYSYSEIEGLDYQWGYTFWLEVEEIIEENPPMDSPGGYFLLKKIIKKERVPEETTFELVLAQPGMNLLLERVNSGLSLMDVDILSDLPTKDLDPLFEKSAATYIGVFQHTSLKNKIRLLNLKTE